MFKCKKPSEIQKICSKYANIIVKIYIKELK